MDRLDPGVDLAVKAFVRAFFLDLNLKLLDRGPIASNSGFQLHWSMISGNEDAVFHFLDPVPSNDGNEEDGADGFFEDAAAEMLFNLLLTKSY